MPFLFVFLYRQDVYVVVIGLMKAFTGSRHIHCHQIRPIKDFNQVHYHLMEALYMHLSSRKPMTVSLTHFM